MKIEVTKVDSLNIRILNLKRKIQLIECEIQNEIITWPRRYSLTLDHCGKKAGLWAIDCPDSKIKDVIEFHFADKNNEVEMSDGALVPLEDYFTKKEIKSLTLMSSPWTAEYNALGQRLCRCGSGDIIMECKGINGNKICCDKR